LNTPSAFTVIEDAGDPLTVHVFDKVIVDVVLLAPVGVERAVTATVAALRPSP
jgi:hypothetical protein